MKYKIGEVAHILGVSPDLLRYYEKKGVVKPEKDETNDYRYYDSWDINFLMDCLWFKNFGFSIEQIADIVRIHTPQDISELMEYKEAELEAQIHRSELMLRRSREQRAELAEIPELLGRYKIEESPALVRFINRVGKDYPSGEGLERFARQWLHAMPFNHRYFEISPQSIESGEDTDCRWGFSLRSDYVVALEFDVRKPMKALQPRRCLTTVFKSCGGKDGFTPQLLKPAMQHAESLGYTVTESIRGELLASVLENGTFYGYFKAWIPIEGTPSSIQE